MFEPSQPAKMADLVGYQDGSIVSLNTFAGCCYNRTNLA